MKLDMVIPCYFRDQSFLNMTNACLNSLKEDVWTIIVNDGSPYRIDPDDIPCNLYIERSDNGGFAAAVNTGLKEAEGDIIIVCNNDVLFIQPDWLDHLLKPLSEGYGISSIRTTDSDGWTTEDRYEENAKFGSIWAITREALDKIGYLDERFGKGLFEDLDYWRRARNKGVKIVKNHAGLVEHQGKATFKKVDPNNDMFMKNMFVYKDKWKDKAHIIETEPNHILLVDDYEIADGKHPKECLKFEVSLADAERRWGKVW